MDIKTKIDKLVDVKKRIDKLTEAEAKAVLDWFVLYWFRYMACADCRLQENCLAKEQAEYGRACADNILDEALKEARK